VHCNGDYDWDNFGAQKYYEHNYQKMRDDDAEMLGLVREWFATAASGGHRKGVDVGSGANLYPALAMLRHCRKITLCDYSKENVAWLRRTIARLPESWAPFWEVLAPGSGDEGFAWAREILRQQCTVRRRSIFRLPNSRWDIGTMFFVAESLSEDHHEFERALGSFFRALRPGAVFAAAFMESSEGYEVEDVEYPAVWIDKGQLEASIRAFAQVRHCEVRRVDINPSPVRAGYTGYLVALGQIKD
jgi:SAM-dependent methyltransferase